MVFIDIAIHVNLNGHKFCYIPCAPYPNKKVSLSYAYRSNPQ